jgi:hypothetical protein
MTTKQENYIVHLDLIEKLSLTKGLSVSSLMSIAIPAHYCL